MRNGSLLALLATLSFLALASWFANLFFNSGRLRQSRGGGALTDTPLRQPAKSVNKGELLATVIIVLGISLIAVDWFVAERTIPAASVTLPVGTTLQAYPTQTTDFSVDVMLPDEVTLRAFHPNENPPIVDIAFGKEEKGENPIQPVRLYEPLLVNGFYWSLIGMESSGSVLRAVITPDSPNAIPAVGGIGDKIHFTINGPAYTVKGIRFDQRAKLGPYVELEDEGGTTFSVYKKPKHQESLPENQILPKLNDGFWLTKIEPSPLATLIIAPEPTIEMLLPALLAILLGLVLMIVSSENSILLGIRSTTRSSGEQHSGPVKKDRDEREVHL